MSFHLLGWFENIADATAVDVQPITDNVVAIQNNHFVPQVNWSGLYASFWIGGAGSGRARLITPQYRQFSPPYIVPVNVDGGDASPFYVQDYRNSPLVIPALEELELEGFQDSAGADDVYGLLGMTRDPRPAPQGNIYTMRGTSTTAQVVDVWTTHVVTWADTLPAGTYAVVGMAYEGVGGIAARLIFEDQIDRPGCPGTGNQQSLLPNITRMGGLGEWGRMTANRMPILETVGDATTAVHTFYMDFVRVA